MVRQGPRSANGGMIALTREPSFKRASTSGELSSMRRPSGETIRSIDVITASSLEKVMSDRVSLPDFSIKISSNLFTIISVTSSFASNSSNGPSPTASFKTSMANFSWSTSGGNLGANSLMISFINFSTCLRS